MKLHKLNLENNYRNLVDSAIAVKAGLTPAVFAARPTYNDVLLGFNDGETPTLLLPKWAQFTIDLSKNKPSWAPASLTGTLTVTITPSVVGVAAEEDEVTLGNVDVYGVSVASTGKQYKVNEGFYSIGLNVMVVDEDNAPVIAYSDGRPMKVVMQKVADNGPDTNVDVAAGGGSFTQEQADWNQSDDTKVDFIKNKPTIPAAQVNADWEATEGVAQILNKPTIPTVNNATLTLKQGDTTLGTFTANASTDVEVSIPAGGGDLLVEKTWSELKAMRDGGTLVPGQQYRITDYVATTTQTDTQSANHPFDIIITADSASKLNEHARAILHSGDTYFANCKLEAWKLWYSIDNDTTKFNWADSTNGKGVVYRMIDEFDNDCPYDFKGIQSKSSGTFYFTFDYSGTDSSINSSYNVKCNVMKPYFDNSGKQSLNKILFLNLNNKAVGNEFDSNCNGITLNGIQVGNKFGFGCFRNTFSGNCFENIIGPGCYDLTFSADCNYNVFGTECNSITLKAGSQLNTFEQKCTWITLGSSSSYYAYCTNNYFGSNTQNISIGTNVTSCKFGNFCARIYFGESNLSLSSYYDNIVIESNVKFVNLKCSGTLSSSSKYKNVKICSGVAGTDSSNYLTITDSNVNQAYQTTFFNEIDGTLKKQEGTTITTVA